MVRIPSFARRSQDAGTATEDRNRDGRIDERDERDGQPGRDERAATTDRPVADTSNVTVRQQVDDRGPRAIGTADRERAEADRTPVRTVETQPRARASLLATLGLVVGVAAALFVLTGVLAGYGVALGIAGLLLSIGGLSATGKRHVAGKSDALLGVALNVGAMIIGALALTGALSWLTTETDKVDQFRQWLDTQFAARL